MPNPCNPLQTVANLYKPFPTTTNRYGPWQTVANCYEPLRTASDPYEVLDTVTHTLDCTSRASGEPLAWCVTLSNQAGMRRRHIATFLRVHLCVPVWYQSQTSPTQEAKGRPCEKQPPSCMDAKLGPCIPWCLSRGREKLLDVVAQKTHSRPRVE